MRAQLFLAEDGAFDAILCIDAICHLPDRSAALTEWKRLLRKGGRLVFTDPFVVTGAVAKDEIDGRSALGSNLFFVLPGFNEAAIETADLTLLSRHDLAAAVAEFAGRWHFGSITGWGLIGVLRFPDRLANVVTPATAARAAASNVVTSAPRLRDANECGHRAPAFRFDRYQCSHGRRIGGRQPLICPLGECS